MESPGHAAQNRGLPPEPVGVDCGPALPVLLLHLVERVVAHRHGNDRTHSLGWREPRKLRLERGDHPVGPVAEDRSQVGDQLGMGHIGLVAGIVQAPFVLGVADDHRNLRSHGGGAVGEGRLWQQLAVHRGRPAQPGPTGHAGRERRSAGARSDRQRAVGSGDELRRRDQLQPLRGRFAEVEFAQHGSEGAAGGLGRGRQFHRAALNNRLVEQAIRGRHAHQSGDLGASARLAEDRHIPRVAPEGGDIVPHPLQRRHQIEHPDVG